VREAATSHHSLNGFGQGAWTGIAEQVKTILDNLQRGVIDGEQLTVGKASMVVDQHKAALIETQSAKREFFPDLVPWRVARSQDYAGRSAGYSYGKSVGLNNQVAGSCRKALGVL
jgi:hypothetical protein